MESPPSGPRWAGLRFQITYVYAVFIPETRGWEDDTWNKKAPVTVQRHLCDIVHAPAKDGATVSKIVLLQLERLGCSLADIVSGSTDGGGENEGVQGVHALMEGHNPLYVRRMGV